MTTRIRQEFIRKSGVRDAKLIIIASEGSETEPQYFNGLKSSKSFHSSKLHLEILKKDTTASAPEWVLLCLDKFAKEYKLKADDELWLLIDRDKWTKRSISMVARACVQKKYSFVLSNPRFEVWLLLHFEKIFDLSTTEKHCLQTKKGALEKRLKLFDSKFSKNVVNFNNYEDFVSHAVANAINLDEKPKHRWPQKLGTRIYLLINSIQNAIKAS